MPKIIKYKVCPITWEKFPIYQMELDIIKKISPTINWKTYSFPEPTYSPKAREIIQMNFRNERHLYKRTCSATWDNIVSIYPKEYKGDVFHFKYYFSDKWDKDNYTLKKPDFRDPIKTFKKLFKKVPKRSLNITWTMENSDYCNYWMNAKDCYMCQIPLDAEKCMYSYTSFRSTLDIDWYINARCEKTYESIFLWDCYNVFYSEYTDSSSDSWFLFNCKNCVNCFGCTNLNGKKYHFLNKELSKQEYFKKISKIIWNHKEITAFKKTFSEIVDYDDLDQNFKWCEKISWWKNNSMSKNLIDCKDCYNLDTAINCRLSWEISDHLSSAYASGLGLSYCHETIWIAQWNKIGFTCLWTNISDSYYNWDVRWAKQSFLSASLLNVERTIFNIAYNQEEYNKIVVKLIENMQKNWDWWKFFSTEISPHPYNDTIANDYYPVNKVIYLDDNKKYLKEEIFDKHWEGTVYVLQADKFISKAYLDFGWDEKLKIKWRTKENNIDTAKLKNCINSVELPNSISNISDDILNKILICKKSKRPYRITKEEFNFYKKHSIPIPRLHPDVRYKKRFKKVLLFLNS